MEIFVYRYDTETLDSEIQPEKLPLLLQDKNTLIWVDFEITNKTELALAEDILLNVFKFHHLTVEDCRENRNQPKVERFPDYLFFIVHGMKNETKPEILLTRELDGYLGDNFVVTVRKEKFRSIESVKQRLLTNPLFVKRGAAYLLHQILDQIVDMYLPLVDDFDAAISELEDRVFKMKKPNSLILEEIMDLRRSVARLKRISVRQLEVFYRISHGEFPQIPENILPFYRDVHDHLLRITDLAESYRDLVSSLFEIHYTVTATKTNEVMKVMTIISTIMLPLSVIAGIYGMNFTNMPELNTRYGYFITLAFMFLVAISLLFYFWRRGWIFEENGSGKAEEK